MPKPTIKTPVDARSVTALKELLGRDVHDSASSKISGMISGIGQAKAAFERKHQELAGAPGLPLAGVEYGEGLGYFRRYQHGNLYMLPSGSPCWVHDAILEKYVSLGGEGGWLGYPATDERGTPDGKGRYNHFEQGSIYWSSATGAHEIHGQVRDKWSSLGWEASWLGYPTSDELPFAEDGRVSVFEHGSLYWWPDTGAIDLGDVVVRYKGLYCFGEQKGAGSDSPYVVFGILPVPPYPPAQTRTGIGDDVDSGDSRPESFDLYRGIPGGLALGIALFEHDSGDPEAYLGLVKQGVEQAGKGVSAGCGALLGAEAAPVCQGLWDKLAPTIVSFVNGLLGTGDDLLGKSSLVLSAKQMVTLAGAPHLHFWGIEYQLESDLLSDGDASYKVYFDVVRA